MVLHYGTPFATKLVCRVRTLKIDFLIDFLIDSMIYFVIDCDCKIDFVCKINFLIDWKIDFVYNRFSDRFADYRPTPLCHVTDMCAYNVVRVKWGLL